MVVSVSAFVEGKSEGGRALMAKPTIHQDFSFWIAMTCLPGSSHPPRLDAPV